MMSSASAPDSSLPPRQQLVAAGKWPIVGERVPGGPAAASTDAASWQVEMSGLVERPRVWSLAEIQTLPAVERTVDIHCVTRWSKPGVRFRGVKLETLLAEARPLNSAHFVSFVAASARDHSTSLPLSACRELEVLLVWNVDGEPLAIDHGGPLRVVTPQRYFYKSLKWLRRIELLAEDRLGFWEAEAGYHNQADPWREQRYLAATLDKRAAESLLASRDFQGRDLRGLQAAHRDLRGLRAAGAALRDASFRRADLRGASFEQANLSNAHFELADLREANLLGADLEGANFEAADLRGADLRRASLFGATFVDPRSKSEDTAARVDATTRFSRLALEQLLPAQAEFVAERGQLCDEP